MCMHGRFTFATTCRSPIGPHRIRTQRPSRLGMHLDPMLLRQTSRPRLLRPVHRGQPLKPLGVRVATRRPDSFRRRRLFTASTKRRANHPPTAPRLAASLGHGSAQHNTRELVQRNTRVFVRRQIHVSKCMHRVANVLRLRNQSPGATLFSCSHLRQVGCACRRYATQAPLGSK